MCWGEYAACKFGWFKKLMIARKQPRSISKTTKMCEEDEKHLKQTGEYHLCGKSYTEKDIRVRDHCHITGEYRGSTHQDCNVNHFRSKF